MRALKTMIRQNLICSTLVAWVESVASKNLFIELFFVTDESPDGQDTESCTYTTTGTYTMSIRAVSQLEDITCQHQFKILNPVTDQFDVIIPNAPIDKEVNPACNYTH
jgi:hypothetical protein